MALLRPQTARENRGFVRMQFWAGAHSYLSESAVSSLCLIAFAAAFKTSGAACSSRIHVTKLALTQKATDLCNADSAVGEGEAKRTEASLAASPSPRASETPPSPSGSTGLMAAGKGSDC